ncbi:hypothetical protein B0H17DRAFT_1190462 [Mycena rosella]|uniref:Uncharacterized protein n=1 Tax=Mycena rosella TaxID=1033263 RepID=A0AAD7H386_MYCRO|nr:hypothetical protein B0H17DRAFT_1190462 [Mycena rosella]
MLHKRNLALVSRRWHEYAEPLLYSVIWIFCSRQARALRHALVGGSSPRFLPLSTTTGTNAGRFVRQLYISISEPSTVKDVHTILKYALQLEVYSVDRTASCGPPGCMLRPALKRCRRLRCLRWSNYEDPSLARMSLELRGCMGLEYLELTGAKPPSVADMVTPPSGGSLILPKLHTLKVAHDNLTIYDTTFLALSTWKMPALRHLIVTAPDFSCATEEGFTALLRVHGVSLQQLELSVSFQDEFYVPITRTRTTTPPAEFDAQALSAWCPQLQVFICSADSDWDWGNPDLIAPHVLLATHPTVESIGIRGIDKWLWDNSAQCEQDLFAALDDQIRYFLSREAFPSLRYIRDMSRDSDLIRRGIWPWRRRPEDVMPENFQRDLVLRFWDDFLCKCSGEGLELQDWLGRKITPDPEQQSTRRLCELIR